MSRSGYTDVDDQDDMLAIYRWRGQVASAIRGKRGQALLCELRDGMDAMPEKVLIAAALERDGCHCALGVVGARRGIDMENIDPEDDGQVAQAFNIAPQLAQEVVYMNDEGHWAHEETPEHRWVRMRKWVDSMINGAAGKRGTAKV